MSDPIMSPDGNFMWTGSEWIPAPPSSSQVANVNLQDSVIGGDLNIRQNKTDITVISDENSGGGSFFFLFLSITMLFLAYSDKMGIYILTRHGDVELIIASITFFVLWLVTGYLIDLEESDSDGKEIIENVIILITTGILIWIAYTLFGP